MTQKNISGYISNRNAYIRAPKDISKNIYSSTIHNSPMLSSVWINELCLISFIWTYLFLLCFTLLCFTDITFFFLRIEGLWQPCVEQVYWHHFSNNICSLHVSMSHFSISCNISSFSIIIIFVMVICDQ